MIFFKRAYTIPNMIVLPKNCLKQGGDRNYSLFTGENAEIQT